MSEKVLMKGNEAVAEAAIRCGCRHFFGYPITPQTEVAAYMSKRMPKIGGTFLQAESEIAAINMVLGASAAGKRVMTSSSSPGISLKTEAISYMAGSDLPAVIVNIQRGGPGLGGIQPSQADYWQATKAPGHGDLRILAFAPNSVQEMVDLVAKAYELADRYRMPALILGDGTIGQMMEPVTLPEDTTNSQPERPWAANGHKNSRENNIINSLYLKPEELERLVQARFARYAQIEATEALHESFCMEGAKYVLVAYGSTARIVKAAVLQAREEGIPVGLIRPITVWPFPKKALLDAAASAEHFLCVEMCMGQMIDDVRLAIECKRPVSFFGHTGGIVPTPDEIVAQIKTMTGGSN